MQRASINRARRRPGAAFRPIGGRTALRAYSLYGLRLKSQWPLACPNGSGASLAEVELFQGPASLFAQAARAAAFPAESTKWFQHARLGDGSIYLCWTELFEFLISADGRRIAGRPLKHATRETFQTYLVGQVLSFALVAQGLEPQHATAVVVDGAAVGFIGDCGYGKSSLGAAFLQAGFPLLTDDLLMIQQDGPRLLAYPGPPRIKLFPEIARRFLKKQVQGTPMNNRTSKVILPLTGRQSCPRPVPLKAIYVLNRPTSQARAERIVIRRLSRRNAFLELLKNTFNPVVVEPERLERQFAQASGIASNLSMQALSYPRSLRLLPAVRAAILEDLGRRE